MIPQKSDRGKKKLVENIEPNFDFFNISVLLEFNCKMYRVKKCVWSNIENYITFDTLEQFSLL